jgi:hypothetical protein
MLGAGRLVIDRVRASICASIAIAMLSSVTSAQETPRVRFSFVRVGEASACTDESVLRARVAERLGYDPFVEASEGAVQRIEGVVERVEPGWRARIYHRDLEGRGLGERVLETELPSCTDLDEAIVLAIALVIDPTRALAAPDDPVETADPEPAPEPEPAPAPEPNAVEEGADPLASPDPTRLEGTLALHGGLALDLVPGWGATMDVEGSVRVADLPLLVLVGFLYVPETRTGDDQFGFGIAAGILGASLVWSEGPLSILPSLKLLIGAIHAVVYELSPLEPGDQPWLGITLDITARIELMHWIFFDVSLGATAPLTRQIFEVEGRSGTVFEEPLVIPGARAGLGLNFW